MSLRSTRFIGAGMLAVAVGWCSLVSAGDPSKSVAAVRKGVEYLQKFHAPKSGEAYNGGTHGLGGSALSGLALLEGGAPKSDPTVLHIAQYVRTNAVREVNTYGAALSLVFLDRLGDRRDVPLIQVLGVRLYEGINAGGGWTYRSHAEPIDGLLEQQLRAVLYNPGIVVPPGRLHPEAERQLRIVRMRIITGGRTGLGQGDDNSNTQFGLLGLWIAARHGLHTPDAIALVESRFLRTQSRTDGGWAYNTSEQQRSTASMTCAGLLALAAGAALRDNIKTGKAFVAAPEAPAAPEPVKEGPNDPFLNPRKVPVARTARPGDPEPVAEKDPEPDLANVSSAVRTAAVQAALMSLGRLISSTPHDGKPVPNGGGPLSNFVGHGNWYYMLWSIERIGVTLGLETIGDVDWYDWGASYLLSCQGADGSWGRTGESYAPDVNTSFAILFLSKANLLSDLSGKMKGKTKDPGRAELRGGGVPSLYAPTRPEPERPNLELPPMIETEPLNGGALPAVKDTAQAAIVAQKLTAATDEQWEDKLIEARDSKGVMNTLGLARAITVMTGVRRKDTRDALADRLTRMTPTTLRGMMRDQDVEIRRAAVLAAAMKDDSAHIPDLIDRLTDPSEMVVRAARAGLKSLTSKDFGPEPGASDDAKVKAAGDWQTWYRTRAK